LRWVFVFAALVMLVTSIPYLFGFTVQGDAWRFTGFVFGVDDGNTYIAKMVSGAYGAWLFRTPYSPYPQGGILAFLPYLLAGKLAQPPGLHDQLVAIYHLFRLTAGFIAILATYHFIQLFIVEPYWQRFALVLATLGGGLGWIFLLSGNGTWLGSPPLEYYSPESFGFLSLYGIPHLSLARALLLWGLVLYLRRVSNSPPQGSNIKTGLTTGSIWLGLGLVQPLDVIIGWAVIGCHLSALFIQRLYINIKKRPTETPPVAEYAWRGSITILVSSPFVIYNVLASSLDPFFKAWTAQNSILSPHPAHYLVAYGLVLLYVAFAIKALNLGREWKFWLPLIWVILVPVLVYAPYNLQRRLAEGVWVPLVVLAVVGLERNPSSRRTLRHFSLYLLFPSTVLLLVGGVTSLLKPGSPFFRPTEEVAAFQYLGTRATPGSIVLSSFGTGNALPAWAPVRVVIGHGPESIGLAELAPRVASFFQSETDDAERLALLEEFGITHVFWGPREQELGDWSPETASYLHLAYTQGDYHIYQVSKATP
jgi:hypothetical protein